MKIYIYGNQSFKKEIHATLESANIKYKLDNNVMIEEIKNITKLKEIIKENPNDIYLIDDDKIIKKKSINGKLKFLAPKDGIEEEYLLQCGIADLAIDSLSELPKYIMKKYDDSKEDEKESVEESKDELEDDGIELDDELSMLLAKGEEEKKFDEMTPHNELDDLFSLDKDINLDEIDDFIDTKDNSKDSDLLFDENFNNDFGLNNISYDYDDNDISSKEGFVEEEDILADLDFLNEKLDQDDDFSQIDSKEDDDIFGELDLLSQQQDDDFSTLSDENSDIFAGLDFLNEDKDHNIEDIEKVKDDELVNEFSFSENIENLQEKSNPFKGEKMDNEFYELDLLNEKDVLEALNYKIEDYNPSNNKVTVSEINKESISVDSSNVNDLSLLLSKLLSNKTLEITIKIKD